MYSAACLLYFSEVLSSDTRSAEESSLAEATSSPMVEDAEAQPTDEENEFGS